MRRLALLATVLAAVLAAVAMTACGAPPIESGNVFVSQSALGTVDGIVDNDAPGSLTPVTIDDRDPGCSVDGLRFQLCTFTQTATADYNGPLTVCELEIANGPNYAWECEAGDDSKSRIEDTDVVLVHCPITGR